MFREVPLIKQQRKNSGRRKMTMWYEGADFPSAYTRERNWQSCGGTEQGAKNIATFMKTGHKKI